MTDKPKRPRDANQLAKFIVDVMTDEVDDGVSPDDHKGRKGESPKSFHPRNAVP